jgi:SNF2 family DNA or RNA helicase
VDNEPNENWVIWCDTDYEANELNKRIPQGVEVRGSMSLDMKEDRLNAFVSGNERILITKPSIAGFGLNLQHCARCAFVGISYSYEAFYQAVRRFWRFGQQRPVNVHVAMAETEGVIWNTIQRKARDHETMKTAMTAAMRRAVRNHETKLAYQPTQSTKLPVWLKGVSK